MRDYARIIPRFWIGKTGRALRGDPVAQSIALYLISGPHANMIGMYYLPIGYISGDTGTPYEGVAKALDKLLTLGFCTYDQDAELVWVHQMMSIQVGERLKNGDNNTVAVARLYESLPESRILSIFYDKYSDTHCLPFRRGLDSPLPRAFVSQEQEQEQKQDKDKEQKKELSAPRSTERNAVPVDLFLTYPCNGSIKEYHLPMSQVNEWSMLYHGLDVAAECKKALAWVCANPSKKKTAKGMPSFLVGWLGRANDKGGRGVVEIKDNSADRAWGIIVKRLHGTALAENETIDTPEIQAAIKAMGGSKYLSSLDTNQLPYVKKDFIAAYKQASK